MSLVIKSFKNGVCTLRMNNPSKLNGWTKSMMVELFNGLSAAAADNEVKAVVITGTGKYYCAGVNLNEVIKPQHPQKLWELIYTENRKTFDTFLTFPKPILIAANGPAIGASVTSATLCDGIIASEGATFSTPFARLGVPPEGCSSVHFEVLMGKENALRMLTQDWAPTATEAQTIGLIQQAVPGGEERLQEAAQTIAEHWVRDNKQRAAAGTVGEPVQYLEKLRAVNDAESAVLASEFLSKNFLMAQYKFLSSKGKSQLAAVFWLLANTRFAWKFMLKQ